MADPLKKGQQERSSTIVIIKREELSKNRLIEYSTEVSKNYISSQFKHNFKGG
jgi:hypothetical protein